MDFVYTAVVLWIISACFYVVAKWFEQESLAWFIFVAIIHGPILEELLFRMILIYLFDGVTLLSFVSLVVSSLIFGNVHKGDEQFNFVAAKRELEKFMNAGYITELD